MNSIHILRATVLTLFVMSVSACATIDSSDSPQSIDGFEHTLSSGIFSLPEEAKSVDWAVLNNATSVQGFRVTVYRLAAGEKVPVSPGPVGSTLNPLHSFHNANSVGHDKPFSRGQDYEVVVEVNSLLVLPTVEVWANHGNTVIPGTRIGPGEFVDISSRASTDTSPIAGDD